VEGAGELMQGCRRACSADRWRIAAGSLADHGRITRAALIQCVISVR
jgi:hypothetical protein